MRSLIERVVLTPLIEERGFEVELIGEIASMIALGMSEKRNGPPPVDAAGRDLFVRSSQSGCGGRI